MSSVQTDDFVRSALGGIWPGHYYSPYPSPEDARRAAEDFGSPPRDLPGIDLNLGEQIRLLHELGRLHGEISLSHDPDPEWRYHRHRIFNAADASILWAMIRYLQPKRIIEVGSGYSSAVAMDVNERFFDGEIDCVFIDPEPDRLRGLMKPTDQVTVHAERVQDVPLSIFDGLEAQDILFLDSSHVVKAGSDVTHLFFSVLPGLKKGVHIHFHDIFWPFEYPPQWIEWQRAWSEAHLLRAFLYENPSFEIRFFSDYLWRFYQHDLSEIFPLMTEDRPGGLWLRKTGDSPGPCSQKASTAAPSTKSPAT